MSVATYRGEIRNLEFATELLGKSGKFRVYYFDVGGVRHRLLGERVSDERRDGAIEELQQGDEIITCGDYDLSGNFFVYAAYLVKSERKINPVGVASVAILASVFLSLLALFLIGSKILIYGWNINGAYYFPIVIFAILSIYVMRSVSKILISRKIIGDLSQSN